jgi:hypothetical protein
VSSLGLNSWSSCVLPCVVWFCFPFWSQFDLLRSRNTLEEEMKTHKLMTIITKQIFISSNDHSCGSRLYIADYLQGNSVMGHVKFSKPSVKFSVSSTEVAGVLRTGCQRRRSSKNPHRVAFGQCSHRQRLWETLHEKLLGSCELKRDSRGFSVLGVVEQPA